MKEIPEQYEPQKSGMVAGRLDEIVSWLIYQCHLIKHRPRLMWHRLWVRRDEFHHSLDMDVMAILAMNEGDKKIYMADLSRRRKLAHGRDLSS